MRQAVHPAAAAPLRRRLPAADRRVGEGDGPGALRRRRHHPGALPRPAARPGAAQPLPACPHPRPRPERGLGPAGGGGHPHLCRPRGRPPPPDQRRVDRRGGHRLLRPHDVAQLPGPPGARRPRPLGGGRGRGGGGGGDRVGRGGGPAPHPGGLGDPSVRARRGGGPAARRAGGAPGDRPGERPACRPGGRGRRVPRQGRRPGRAGRGRGRGGGDLGLPQRQPGNPGELVLPGPVGGRRPDHLVELLRGRPDPDARQPDAGDPAVAGAGDLALRGRAVRPQRHRRPALLPVHRAAGQAHRPPGEVPPQPARGLPRLPPADHLPGPGGGPARRDDHRALAAGDRATSGPTPTTRCSP